jgi:hypothetical protein
MNSDADMWRIAPEMIVKHGVKSEREEIGLAKLMPMKLLALTAVLLASTPAFAKTSEYISYSFEGVTFDDGSTAKGSFNFQSIIFGTPQFFDIEITTNTNSVFTTSTYCWNNQKKDTCAPGDDLLITVSTGTYGQPDYDAFQFAGWYAPNESTTVRLDPTVSYETYCTGPQSCTMRHVVSGAFVFAGSTYP